MNFGGIHFVVNLFFLTACAGITLFYINLFYMLLVFLLRIRARLSPALGHWWAEVKEGRKLEQATPLQRLPNQPLPPYFNKAMCRKAFRLVLVLVSVLYLHQRISWMGNDNTHYKAKEYWISGQVVYTHSIALRFLSLHPDNPLIQPYTQLLKVIYMAGQRYLPENDAERYVWKNVWFLYPYTKWNVLPYFATEKSDKIYIIDGMPRPKMIRLLDICWETMEGIATGQISDPQIKTESDLTFPFLVSYSSLYQGFYTGSLYRSGVRTNENKRCIARNRLMLGWLDDLYASWQKRGVLKKLKTDHPFVLCVRQDMVLMLVRKLVVSLPLAGTFSCNHPLMKRMYKEYQDIMSDDPNRNFYLNFKRANPEQASRGYYQAVYGPLGSAGNYLLEYVCKKKMPRELHLFNSRYALHHSFNRNHEIRKGLGVENVFEKQLKPLLTK